MSHASRFALPPVRGRQVVAENHPARGLSLAFIYRCHRMQHTHDCSVFPPCSQFHSVSCGVLLLLLVPLLLVPLLLFVLLMLLLLLLVPGRRPVLLLLLTLFLTLLLLLLVCIIPVSFSGDNLPSTSAPTPQHRECGGVPRRDGKTRSRNQVLVRYVSRRIRYCKVVFVPRDRGL